MDKYNTKVRQAISDKYVECSRNKAIIKQLEETSTRLINEIDSLTYKKYLELNDELINLNKKVEKLNVEIDTWDYVK